jgi:soluble lytic murein transglycosylase
MHLRYVFFLPALVFAAALAQPLPPGLTRQGDTIAMQPIGGSDAVTAGQRPSNIHVLSPSDHDIFSRAFLAADHGDWAMARSLADQGHDPVARQLVEWRYLLDHNSGAPFEEIDAFLRNNPGWPLRDTLVGRAEEAITPQMSPAAVLSWFGTRNPTTAMGRIRLGEALAATGQTARAGELIRQGWIEGSFDVATELAIVQRDGAFLTPDVDRRRLDNLLWRGQLGDARREIARVDDEEQRIAAARIALQANDAHARQTVALVAGSDDAGLLFDRAHAARRNSNDADAEALLLRVRAAGPAREHPDRWWGEVNVVARDALAAGRATTAYALLDRDGLTSGDSYADSEFLAGFIALRFLKDARSALVHFQRLDAGVTRPISKSRAYYWEGRCYEALGDVAQAAARYRLAAAMPETFYGQVALTRISAAPLLHLDDTPVEVAPPAEFDADPYAPEMRVLGDLGQQVWLRIFVTHDSELNPAPRHLRQLMQVMTEWGFRAISVRLAKAASYSGIDMLAFTHPIIPLPPYIGPGPAPEPAIVLGLIRQETEFDPYAVSGAGARGIMQMMGFAAQKSAGIAGAPYRPDALLSDVSYNIQLGMIEFAGHQSRWGGSLILAAASYNGGPTNVRRWIGLNGDPRLPGADPIDWIEQIPFSETRNYVMRVVENTQVYRNRLAGHDMPLRILADLYAPNAPPTEVLAVPVTIAPVKAAN